jgi:peptidoglycan L-alanyl-D-glutamate endopeptidase CwlK
MDNSLTQIQTLHPALRPITIQGYNTAVKQTPAGIHPVIAEALRTFDRSTQLYRLGRDVVNPDGRSKVKPMGNIVSFAQAGLSWHNYGLAFDWYLLINGKPSYTVDANWMLVVKIFEDLGFNSGINFPTPDEDHLENKMGQTLSGLLLKYHAAYFIPGTQYVNF